MLVIAQLLPLVPAFLAMAANALPVPSAGEGTLLPRTSYEQHHALLDVSIPAILSARSHDRNDRHKHRGSRHHHQGKPKDESDPSSPSSPSSPATPEADTTPVSIAKPSTDDTPEEEPIEEAPVEDEPEPEAESLPPRPEDDAAATSEARDEDGSGGNAEGSALDEMDADEGIEAETKAKDMTVQAVYKRDLRSRDLNVLSPQYGPASPIVSAAAVTPSSTLRPPSKASKPKSHSLLNATVHRRSNEARDINILSPHYEPAPLSKSSPSSEVPAITSTPTPSTPSSTALSTPSVFPIANFKPKKGHAVLNTNLHLRSKEKRDINILHPHQAPSKPQGDLNILSPIYAGPLPPTNDPSSLSLPSSPSLPPSSAPSSPPSTPPFPSRHSAPLLTAKLHLRRSPTQAQSPFSAPPSRLDRVRRSSLQAPFSSTPLNDITTSKRSFIPRQRRGLLAQKVLQQRQARSEEEDSSAHAADGDTIAGQRPFSNSAYRHHAVSPSTPEESSASSAPEPAEPEESMEEAKGEDADSSEAEGDSRDGEKADRDVDGQSREKASA